MELKDLFFERHPNAMFIFDADTLEIIKVNRRFTDMYGYSRDEALELTVLDVRPGEDISDFKQQLKERDKESANIYSGAVRHQTKEGSILHVQVATQFYPMNGRKTHVVHIHDLTENVQLKNKYKQTLDELRHHIEENPLAMVKFDHNFRIIGWSKRAEEQFGYTQAEAQDRTSFELEFFPESEHDLIQENIRGLISGQIEKIRFSTIAVKKSGEQIHVRVHASALRTNADELKSVVAFIENITDAKRIEQLFKTTEEIGQIGGWEYNPNSDELYWSEQVYRIYDLPMSEKVDVEKALSFFVPEDKERISEDLSRSIEDRQSYDAEYRLVTSAGKQKWVRALGRPIIRNGNVFKVTGTLQDITQQKMKEKEITQSAKEKEVLLAEVHHRVKNNLAIISGLLELKAMSLEEEQITNVLRQSQLRIQSMAMIHEALYEAEDFSNVQFCNFVDNLITAIEGAHEYLEKNIRINVRCNGTLQLNVNQAIPCGLIINELVTNSFKHAFDGLNKGKIEVSVQHHASNNEVQMQVTDNGRGLPEEFMNGQSDSLGATLLQQLTRQLEGKLSLQNNEGAHVELRFKKSDQSGPSSQHFSFN